MLSKKAWLETLDAGGLISFHAMLLSFMPASASSLPQIHRSTTSMGSSCSSSAWCGRKDSFNSVIYQHGVDGSYKMVVKDAGLTKLMQREEC